MKRRRSTGIILDILRFVKGRLSTLSLLISIGIVNFFIFLPYFKSHLLVGWDTPIYMYYIFYVEKYGVIATFMSGVIDKPLYALMLYTLSNIGASPEQLLKVLPLMFGSFYIISTYLLLRESSKDCLLASLAALFSCCSLSTLRLANDLQPHFLALSCMMIAMYFHLKYVNNGNRKYVFFQVITTLFMLLVHPLTYVVYIVILIAASFIRQGTKKSQKCKREVIGAIACILPLIGVMLFALFTTFKPIITLAENLSSPVLFSQRMSQVQLRNALIHSTPLFIFSMIGIAVLLRHGGTFKRTLLVWTAFFLLASLLSASFNAIFAYRFILALPLPILAAYGFRGWSNRARLKSLLLIAVMLTSLSAATLHQLYVKPKINEKLREELIWIRENLGEKKIVPVYPFSFLSMSEGYWVLGLVGDYLYYGEVLPLLARKPENYSLYPSLDTVFYWKMLEANEVCKNLSEYEIVLVSGLYELSVVDEQITRKIDHHDIYSVDHSVVANESKVDYYYNIWRRFKDVKIAVIGEDWLDTRKILYELWIPSVSDGTVTPSNIQYLGTDGLPAFDNSTNYDILILANWDAPLNRTEAEKLLEYFNEGCAIVATSKSLYKLNMTSPQAVEAIFGIEKVYPPDASYSNLTYCTQHYVTSNFSIPFNSTGAENGVPVSNFTTAQGIASVTSSEDLYLLAVNQRNDTRTAHFGLEVSEMNENDIIIFKKLLLWVLHLEACQK